MWTSYGGQDGASGGVFGQRFDASGGPAGVEFQINTHTSADQTFPSVAVDADGDFVVVWRSDGQDGSSFGIFGQRFDASGARQGSEFRVNSFTTSSQDEPSVAVDSLGNFVVVWQSTQDGSGRGVFAQRFDASGTPQGSEFQVNTWTSESQLLPSVGIDSDGDFVVTWTSTNQDGSSHGVFGQRFNASGVAQGSEFQVNSFTSGSQYRPSVTVDADGDFVVVWESNGQDGDSLGVFAQRFDASGTRQGSEFQVNSYTPSRQYLPSVAFDSDGNFVVSWTSYTQDGDLGGIFGQHFDAAGIPIGSEFQVNTYTNNFQYYSPVGFDGSGNFVVAWNSYAQDGDLGGIFARLSISDADLSVTKTVEPERVSAGEEVTYTITVANAGPADATNVSVEDVLAEGLIFVSSSTSQGTGCTESAGTVTCDLGTIANGADATATIVVVMPPGTYENTATATSDQNDADGAAGAAPAVSAAGSDIPVNDVWMLGLLALVLAAAGWVVVRR